MVGDEGRCAVSQGNLGVPEYGLINGHYTAEI